MLYKNAHLNLWTSFNESNNCGLDSTTIFLGHPLDNFQAEMTQVTELKLMPFTPLSVCLMRFIISFLHQVFFVTKKTFTILLSHWSSAPIKWQQLDRHHQYKTATTWTAAVSMVHYEEYWRANQGKNGRKWKSSLQEGILICKNTNMNECNDDANFQMMTIQDPKQTVKIALL